MKMQLMTCNAIAELLGLDRRVVALRLGGVKPDGKIGRRDGFTLKTYFRAVDDRKPAGASNGAGVADDTGSGSYTHERARLTAEKARLAEIERLEREGALVTVEQVAETWGALTGVIRTRLLALPAKCAVRVGMARNAVEVQAILKAEIRELLTELSATTVRRNGDAAAAPSGADRRAG